MVRKVLCVAEKNDAARGIAECLSGGRYRRREGRSKYNKIYEFDYTLFGQPVTVAMTSVSGHLLNYDFLPQYSRNWNSCDPLVLFDAPIEKTCHQNYQPIRQTLQQEARGAQTLIIWTDCDREGENIGYEIIDTCLAVNPHLQVHRARFSEITKPSVIRAIENLDRPDKKTSDAVDCRQELDLRIGAAFTRFQTLRLRRVFPQHLSDYMISYGSCQFPTLGFVVERYKQRENFIGEPFWKIKVLHTRQKTTAEFNWKRFRLFDQLCCEVLHERCLEKPTATVENVQTKPKSKWRPVALDTVEMEKLASKKLGIGAKRTMTIAEKLYTQGYISYPRTETNRFPNEINLRRLVEMQCVDPNWGPFAQRILQDGPFPRNGNKSDQAHPPIHPTAFTQSLNGDERKLYEFIVRHFLACLSADAKGMETIVDIDINKEKFSATGLIILEENYLEVYPYDRWNAKLIPEYENGEKFQPEKIDLVDGQTSAPPLLTEADLIALMDKHGIGTDATHAEHIEKIKTRDYVGLTESENRLIPGFLGLGLVEGYDLMGFEMSKPHLRAELEADLKRICEGGRSKEVVLREQIQKYRDIFVQTMAKVNCLDEALARQFSANPTAVNGLGDLLPEMAPKVMKCPQCRQGDMQLKQRQNNAGWFIGCGNYPKCKNAIWLPKGVIDAEVVSDEACPRCTELDAKMIKFHFRSSAFSVPIPSQYKGCVLCDPDLRLWLFESGSSSSAPAASSSAGTGTGSSGGDQRKKRPIPVKSDSSTFIGAPSRGITIQRSSDPEQILCDCGHVATAMVSQRGQNAGRTYYTCAVCQFKHWEGDPLNQVRVLCDCGRVARMKISKTGKNSGRQFYECPKLNDQDCEFFAWKEDAMAAAMGPAPGSSAEEDDRSLGVSAPDEPPPNCECGAAASLKTVQKQGPNTGRLFYCCGNDRRCNFFQWADAISSPSQRNAPANGRRGSSPYQRRSGGRRGRGGFRGKFRGGGETATRNNSRMFPDRVRPAGFNRRGGRGFSSRGGSRRGARGRGRFGGNRGRGGSSSRGQNEFSNYE